MKLLLCSRMEDIDVLKGMLAEEGIPCEVTNDSTPLPGAEFYPKLWIVDDADFSRASAVLDTFRGLPAAEVTPWTCLSCGEQSEGQFSSCWKCGAKRPEKGAAPVTATPTPPIMKPQGPTTEGGGR